MFGEEGAREGLELWEHGPCLMVPGRACSVEERPLLGLPLVPVGSFGGLPWGESRECGLRRGRQELRLYLERAVYFRAEPLPRGLKRHDALTFRRALAKIQRRQA